MLDYNELEIIKKDVENLITEEKIVIEKKEKGIFVNFFLENSRKSIDSSKLLMEISNNSDLKEKLGYPNFDGYLWVINSSYYSMFYLTRALLDSAGIKIKSDSSIQSIHHITFKCLVYFFYLNKESQPQQAVGYSLSFQLGRRTNRSKLWGIKPNWNNKKLEGKLIEDFQEAGEEAAEILGKEKAKRLIEEYESEKDKRGRFTYKMGEIAIRGKAETSLNRAIQFNTEIRKTLETK